VEELKRVLLTAIPLGYLSRTRRKHATARFRDVWFEGNNVNSAGLPVRAEYDSLRRNGHKLIRGIRDALLDQRPPIILLSQYSPCCGLDDISLLREYNEIDATGLTVVKR
jgi:hypothetical protein